MTQANKPDAERELREQLDLMRRVAHYQQVVILVLVMVVAVMASFLWQYRGVNTYLGCLNAYAMGVVTPQCAVYRDYIDRNTNVKNPGGNLDERSNKPPQQSPPALPR